MYIVMVMMPPMVYPSHLGIMLPRPSLVATNKKHPVTMVMNRAGINDMRWLFFFNVRYMVIAHSVMVASTWLLHAKYRHMMSNPLTSMTLYVNIAAVMVNMGMATKSLFFMLFWSILSISATMSLAERSAVSPEVTAALMTPMIVMVATNGGNHSLAMMPTIELPLCPALSSGRSKKKYEAAAAQMSATTPSVIIDP